MPRMGNLPGDLATLHHGRILLLESLVQSSGALQLFVDTAHHTLLLAVDQGFGGEVSDTVIETTLNHLRVHLEETHRLAGE